MLTVDDFGEIRRAHRDGISVRGIARTLHHSRRKIREALATPEPQAYTRRRAPPAPMLGPFHAIIDAILTADEQAPRKQRHTAHRVDRRAYAASVLMQSPPFYANLVSMQPPSGLARTKSRVEPSRASQPYGMKHRDTRPWTRTMGGGDPSIFGVRTSNPERN